MIVHPEKIPAASLPSKERLCFEGVGIYAAVLVTCKIFFELRGQSRFLDLLFEPLVLVLWVYVPTFFIMGRRLDFAFYGITLLGDGRPWGERLRCWWQRWVKTTLVTTVLIIPVFVVGYWIYSEFLFHRGLRTHFGRGWGQMAAGQLFVIGFPEEFFFRGFLQTHLNRAFREPIRIKGWKLSFFGVDLGWGLFLTSALFALGHIFIEGGPQRLAVFFPSLLFGWLRDKTGTIASSSIVHAICNITIFTLEGGY